MDSKQTKERELRIKTKTIKEEEASQQIHLRFI